MGFMLNNSRLKQYNNTTKTSLASRDEKMYKKETYTRRLVALHLRAA